MSLRCPPDLRTGLISGLAVCCVVCLTAAKKAPISKLTLDPDAPVVDLFDGIDEGTFDVRVVARDEYAVQVHITNTSAVPQTVKLPKAAVGVHVLKQQFPFQFPPPPGSSPFGPNNLPFDPTGLAMGPGQTLGGNFSPPTGSSLSPFFPGGTGMFSIPPQSTVQIPFNSVCLEHGKPAPISRMTYVLRPIDEKPENDALRQLLENYDPRKTHRKVMQAAAWHLGGGMSWEALAAKRVRHLGGLPNRYLTRQQLEAAHSLAAGGDQDSPRVRTNSRVRSARR